MSRLGMPISDTTILRSLKEHVRARSDNGAVHDWAWRKGANYGTIIVNLERRQVVDVLADRSAATTASWFKDHPEVEVVSRDRVGLYAEAARQGAPQARQVADRFHLLQNFRETVERQLGRFEAPISDSQVDARDNQVTPPLPARSDCPSDAAAQKRLIGRGRQAVRQELFDEIRTLFEGGSSVREIARKLGLGRRRVERWVRRIDLPDRNTMASKPCTPAYFGALLARRWAEGITKVRRLFAEIRHHGYIGSYSHLARFLAPWRSCEPSFDGDEQLRAEQEEPAPVRMRTLDPMTGRAISPLTAAALCVKPRGLTARRVANIDALKAASAEFTAMRHLAMRFRGLLRGGTTERLDAWLIDARASGIYAMQRFARTIRQDLEAVRNAVLEPWSNGQTEGQINKLKTLKRAMYGRAGVDLLRARMMPLQEDSLHQE
jgi:Transposase/Helix-turn-helix domain